MSSAKKINREKREGWEGGEGGRGRRGEGGEAGGSGEVGGRYIFAGIIRDALGARTDRENLSFDDLLSHAIGHCGCDVDKPHRSTRGEGGEEKKRVEISILNPKSSLLSPLLSPSSPSPLSISPFLDSPIPACQRTRVVPRNHWIIVVRTKDEKMKVDSIRIRVGTDDLRAIGGGGGAEGAGGRRREGGRGGFRDLHDKS